MTQSTFPSQPEESPQEKKGFFQRNAFAIKLALIGTLVLLLLIPLAMVDSLVYQRESLAQQTRQEITSRWSGTQTLTGPVLTLSYREKEDKTSPDKASHAEIRQIDLLPDELSVQGEVRTQTLRRSIYEAIVYRSHITLEGTFRLNEDEAAFVRSLSPETADARVSVGITDLRGLEKPLELSWNGDSLTFASGEGRGSGLLSGVAAAVDATPLLQADTTVRFRIEMELKGSDALYFAPIGRTTSIRIESDCPTPSFTGNFLPSHREVRSDGFSAQWDVIGMNRNYPQVFDFTAAEARVQDSVFGVELLVPVAQYQMTERAVKYAILILLLTFVVVLFAETLLRRPLGIFHYLLVGLALTLFYSLLIALSEHLRFGWSYAIASVMIVGMLFLYTYALLREKKAALGVGGMLTGLYLYIYILLQMETYALLAGSLGLFVILAGVMFVSQKINRPKGLSGGKH